MGWAPGQHLITLYLVVYNVNKKQKILYAVICGRKVTSAEEPQYNTKKPQAYMNAVHFDTH